MAPPAGDFPSVLVCCALFSTTSNTHFALQHCGDGNGGGTDTAMCLHPALIHVAPMLDEGQGVNGGHPTLGIQAGREQKECWEGRDIQPGDISMQRAQGCQPWRFLLWRYQARRRQPWRCQPRRCQPWRVVSHGDIHHEVSNQGDVSCGIANQEDSSCRDINHDDANHGEMSTTGMSAMERYQLWGCQP